MPTLQFKQESLGKVSCIYYFYALEHCRQFVLVLFLGKLILFDTVNSLSVSGIFYSLMITFANSLDPE